MNRWSMFNELMLQKKLLLKQFSCNNAIAEYGFIVQECDATGMP